MKYLCALLFAGSLSQAVFAEASFTSFVDRLLTVTASEKIPEQAFANMDGIVRTMIQPARMTEDGR